jgi:phage terminase large subunit-like protein
MTRRARTPVVTEYAPYRKQLLFHDAGAGHRERLFMAGNQVGKSLAGAMEAAIHLTGLYPAWWQGRRFQHAPSGWAAGITQETTRDVIERLLVGRPGRSGTGVLPGELIFRAIKSANVSGAVDTLIVEHVSGEPATLALKSYEKGRTKWQGETLDFVWFDEEPPAEIYSEGLTRVAATGGLVFLTFTPLLGLTELVHRFLENSSPDRHVVQMTIDEAAHIPESERARIVAGYPAHEREARAKGVPMLGSGRIFPVPEEQIAVAPFEIPRHWSEIGGIDFGWDHPTAAVTLAWDRDADCLYVTRAYQRREAVPAVHAAALRDWGAGLPWAWPQDGLQHSRDSGAPLAEQYRKHGLLLLPQHAQFADGSAGVEAGILEMLERMETGRWKVFRPLEDWFREFRLYHRKEGRVVKLADDLLSASRYALMMRRFAERPGGEWPNPKRIVYPEMGIV